MIVTAVMLALAVGGVEGQADAAVVRAYADGPVVYFNKGETRFLAATSAGSAALLVSAYIGPEAGIVVGAGLSNIADQYASSQTASGRCLMVKMRYWNPRWTYFSWYSWWPCY
ncbi:MAG: hypothetical protein U0Y82_11455 [Thermoleophilia bacterium]